MNETLLFWTMFMNMAVFNKKERFAHMTNIHVKIGDLCQRRFATSIFFVKGPLLV